MRTRHLVGLISGVLILSVLLPVGLSIWLAHQQVETSFIEELGNDSNLLIVFYVQIMPD
ncbi:hypothetical protein, partial [Escherichia coli]|uniref:hypothetical protein n=1 Tax=Escherichia coli TaxID=562 RepID=UPI0023AA7D19